MHAASSAFWDRIAHRTLKRPLLTWLVTLGLIVPAAVLGLRTVYTQDILTEMPGKTTSVQALRAVVAEEIRRRLPGSPDRRHRGRVGG